MSKEFAVMKTSLFGGFKKSDVLTFVESLQTETAEVKEMLDQKKEEALELKKKIEELEDKLDELSAINDKLAEKEAENAELKKMLDDALLENKQLSEKSVEFNEMSEKLKRAEKQIGAAYIDARRYSDDLVENAKSKAKDIGAFASQDIKKEASEIEALLKDVDLISKKFNSSIEQLHKDVYALSSKLNSSASNLLNLHTDLSELEAHNFDYDDDVTYSVRDEYVSVSYDEDKK